MSSTLTLVLKQIGPSVMLPMLVYEIGNGALMPIVALTALDAGASTSVASLMLSGLGVGTILGGAHRPERGHQPHLRHRELRRHGALLSVRPGDGPVLSRCPAW